MGKSPAFQFYPNEWLGSQNVTLMTAAEEGAYIRLLAYAWGNIDCGLEDDDQILSVLSRLGEGWFNGGSLKVRKCFIERNGKLYNERLLEERKKQEEWAEKSRQAGIKSGKVRNFKRLNPEGWLNQVSTGPVEPNTNTSSSSSSSSSNKYINATFDEFWKLYPTRKGRKLGKKKALEYFKKVKQEDYLLLLEATKNYAESQASKEGFARDPHRFIKDDYWMDLISKPKTIVSPKLQTTRNLWTKCPQCRKECLKVEIEDQGTCKRCSSLPSDKAKEMVKGLLKTIN